MKKTALLVANHPDFQEIIAKLLMKSPVNEISEWLESKYSEVAEKRFVLSAKTISTFEKDYLDFYKTIKNDSQQIKNSFISSEDELKLALQDSPTYRNALEKYTNSEIDIKVTIKKLVAAIETRAAQVFDMIQENDPNNIKLDRTLIEWFNLLMNTLERFDTIHNGSVEQVNIQNNINIQILDKHINVIYEIIKKILEQLDYDSSLVFMEMFNEEMSKINTTTPDILPQEARIMDIKQLETVVSEKLIK